MPEIIAGRLPRDDSRQSQVPTLRVDIETIRLHASSLIARLQNRVSIDTLRPLPTFMGMNPVGGLCMHPAAFTPPTRNIDKTTPEKISSRVRINLAYFLTNYVLVAAMVALVVALLHPGMILFLLVIYALWTAHAFMIRNEVVFFGIPLHSILTIQQRFYLLFVLTTIVVVWKCLKPTLIFALITFVLVTTHALMRDPKQIETSSHGHLLDDEEAENSSGSEIMVERGDAV